MRWGGRTSWNDSGNAHAAAFQPFCSHAALTCSAALPRATQPCLHQRLPICSQGADPRQEDNHGVSVESVARCDPLMLQVGMLAMLRAGEQQQS